MMKQWRQLLHCMFCIIQISSQDSLEILFIVPVIGISLFDQFHFAKLSEQKHIKATINR